MPRIDIEAIDRRVKWWLLVVSLATLVLMIAAALQENVFTEWRSIRKQYAQVLREVATDPRGEAIADQFAIRIDQNVLPELGAIDRCITCHPGVDDPRLADQEQPFRTHPAGFLTNHPPEKYGCTICHQGQGRATVLPDAHGEVPYWPEPLLTGELVYTSCGRCHYDNDLYGGESDLYGPDYPVGQITQGELAAEVPGAEAIARGKQLVIEHGCLGCHKYRNRGGSLGPDITHVGDKRVHDFDFTHVDGEPSVFTWLVAHFESPAMVVPDTLMPDMGLSDEEAQDLATYMISLKRKSAPANYTPLPRLVDRTPAEGDTLYGMFCSSCHGADGVGAVARDSETYGAIDRLEELLTPSLRNEDTLAVASDDYLRAIIARGRTGTNMPAWSGDGGLSTAEIDRLVAAIRAWQDAGPPLESISAARGNARFGRALYRSRCTGCHGRNGEGGIGVTLSSPSFLSVASDDFLRDTIVGGRPNTAMPSWKQLDADEVSDLIAHIRTWDYQPAEKQTVLASLSEGPADAAAFDFGAILYRGNCQGCHGVAGEGGVGPSLNNEAFLSIVDDAYLFDAIIEGHPGTAMPSWRRFSATDVTELIAFLRRWNDGRRRTLEPYMARGDWDRGRIIFEGACAGCHGFNAEGGTGPQLANSVFLASADDAMLREWVSHGRAPTEMRPFLKGEQGVVELTTSQVEDVVTHLRYLQGRSDGLVSRPGMGIVPNGAETFAGVCAACHGPNGEGLTGPALSNQDFLHSASDGYLMATIVMGRDETEMRSMGKGSQGVVELAADDLQNLVAFLRNWEYDAGVEGVPLRRVTGSAPDVGGQLFTNFCAGCHGWEGDDGWAPALNNADFLAAATDGFLQATIARGRDGTAMRAFSRGSEGLAPLTGEQIDDIVSFIRTWAH